MLQRENRSCNCKEKKQRKQLEKRQTDKQTNKQTNKQTHKQTKEGRVKVGFVFLISFPLFPLYSDPTMFYVL